MSRYRSHSASRQAVKPGRPFPTPFVPSTYRTQGSVEAFGARIRPPRHPGPQPSLPRLLHQCVLEASTRLGSVSLSLSPPLSQMGPRVLQRLFPFAIMTCDKQPALRCP